MFYGMYVDEPADNIWLTLEYLHNSQRLSEILIPPTQPLIQVVRSIGRMHAICETIRPTSSSLFLKSYDAEYYRGWSRRTRQFSRHLTRLYPWLPTLCERFEKSLIPLLNSPQTLIHGECYPENVLVVDKDIYLVDWESAALGAGEIDLASITEAWPELTVQECALAYGRVRWAKGSPANFLHRFDLARVYVQLRWLGDRPEWTSDPKVAPRFEQLGCLGQKLGLI
jgi:aminoglycoside phosphotransferase (APT) family kinase protein